MQKMRLRPELCPAPHWGNSPRSPRHPSQLGRGHPSPHPTPLGVSAARRRNFWLRHWLIYRYRCFCMQSADRLLRNPWTRHATSRSLIRTASVPCLIMNPMLLSAFVPTTRIKVGFVAEFLCYCIEFGVWTVRWILFAL